MWQDFFADLRRYRRERFEWYEPSLWVILWYRVGQSINKLPRLIRTPLIVAYMPVYMLLTLLTGIHLPRGCRIGPGLRVFHFGGVFLNPRTVIGEQCTLRHNVTIGNRAEDDDVPTIGNHVEIGVGAVVLGRIRIGDNVRIGANAVVLRDVPPHCSAVGNPARIIDRERPGIAREQRGELIEVCGVAEKLRLEAEN